MQKINSQGSGDKRATARSQPAANSCALPFVLSVGSGVYAGISPGPGLRRHPLTPSRPRPLRLADPTKREGKYVEVNGARASSIKRRDRAIRCCSCTAIRSTGALFSRNREALAERTTTVITPDQRGYGMSEAPSAPDTIAVYAQDALSVMDQLNLKQAIIVGHSMGGPITLEMYKRAPDRFRGVILIDTIAAQASTIEAALWGGFVDEVQQNGISSTFVNALIKDMLSGDTRLHRPGQVKFLTQVIKQASVDGAVGGARALASRPDYMPLLGQIKVPTLVYVGVEDTIYLVPISKMMNKAIPNSDFVTIPGAAHAAIFEAPAPSTKAILDWADGIG